MPQEQYQVTSIASLISWQANADAVSYGAAVVTLANRTDINALQDVVGKTVSYYLQACSLGCNRLSDCGAALLYAVQAESNIKLMLHAA